MIRKLRLKKISTKILFLATMLVALSFKTFAQDTPNVLFIAVDDLKTIGTLYSEEKGDFLRHIYPDENLRKEVAMRMTPNFQRLADDGVAFMNAYTASPACNPSRAAIMTGVRPHETGLVANFEGIFFREWEYQGEKPLADAITLTELLKANGWYTAETGKIFHGTGELDMADGYRSWNNWTFVDERPGNFQRSQYSPPKGLPFGKEGTAEDDVSAHNDLQAAAFIAKVLEKGKAKNDGETFKLPKNKPFFLAFGIYKPHLPFVTTQDMIDLFPVEEMKVNKELLQFFIDDASDLPPIGLRYSGTRLDDEGDPVLGQDRFVDVLNHGLSINPERGDMDAWKDMLKHYFACVATADRALGRVLDALERSKYAENTMVILWSDHGYHLGEKIHVSKFTFWDDASRVYFMIKDPRNPQSAGNRCYQPVSLIDIYPTVANMAGLELPDKRISGRDLTPLLKDPESTRMAPAHTTFRTADSHMIRDKQYKLIRYENDNNEVELYDMLEDDEEYYNLAKKPEYQSTLEKMKAMMETAIQQGKYDDE